MRKREIVFAALAASMLTVGTANAFETEASCMDTCTNTFGSFIFVTGKQGTHTRGLTGCSTSYTYNGDGTRTATTTCTYTQGA